MKAYFMDESGDLKPFIMGCYGWGVSRTMAAVVEQLHDDEGIIWPISIAPYVYVITTVNMNRREQVETAEKIYEYLLERGEEVVLDDRMVTPGVKFKDADLMGFPIRITVGKSVEDGEVEVKKRYSSERIKVSLKSMSNLGETLEKLIAEYDPHDRR